MPRASVAKRSFELVVADYVIVKQLSQGEDGLTYLAVPRVVLERGITRSSDVRREVCVVKVPRDDLNVRFFAREVEIMDALHGRRWCPNVLGESPKVKYPYLAQYWVRGPTIHRFLRDFRGHVPTAYIWSIMADLLTAIVEMRSGHGHRPLIHRDLHTNNVMLDFHDLHDNGIPRIKVIDYSRAVTNEDQRRFQRDYWKDLDMVEHILKRLSEERVNRDHCGSSDPEFQTIRANLAHPVRLGLDLARLHRFISYALGRRQQAPSYQSGFPAIVAYYSGSKLLDSATIDRAVEKWRSRRRR